MTQSSYETGAVSVISLGGKCGEKKRLKGL